MDRYGFMKNSEGYFDPTAGTVLRAIERSTKLAIRRGDIYWVEITGSTGHEMDKDRPAIIVSCDALCETSPLAIGLQLDIAPPTALQGSVSKDKPQETSQDIPKDSVLLSAKDALTMETELAMYKRLYEGLLDRVTGRATA